MPYKEDSLQYLIEQLSTYLCDTLGVRVFPHEWENDNIPLYLQENFKYYITPIYEATEVLNKKILFCIFTESQTPIAIEKFLRNVTSAPDVFPVLVQKNISSYVRRRLVEKRVPFIVPGSQLYLPFVAVDFRERIAKEKSKSHFSAFGQYVLLRAMLEHNKHEWTQLEIADRFSCSRMTASRVFQEFIQFGVAEYLERDYRGERGLLLRDRHYIWTQAQPYLKSPVRKKIYIRGVQFQDKTNYNMLVLAGESALAEISMLVPPKIPVYAIKMELAKLAFTTVPYPDEPGTIELELWRHPVPLTENGLIHPLALYLSLKDSRDERVQSELTKVVNELIW